MARLPQWILSGLILNLSVRANPVETLHNVDHIFNAIHSSMRQWGSTLNHNGVSFFRADVPKGVQLHHGTGASDRIEGMEWLAFEPEHAMNFAFKVCDDERELLDEELRFMSPRWWHLQRTMDDSNPTLDLGQDVLRGTERPIKVPGCLEPGWIHTYAPTRDLHLLYIDGMSAAKSARGVQDSQDHILLWNKTRVNDPRDPREDLRRGRSLCELAEDDFEGKIDGFIRMEHGFEVVLCDFSLLEVVSILRSAREGDIPGPIGHEELDEFSFLRAITSRYFGIGGSRVRVDTESFVTAFNHPEIDFWPDGAEQPRLNKISNATASVLFGEIKRLVFSDHKPIEERTDWQSIADMYVDRYARPIQNMMSSSTFNTAEAVHKETRRLFQPYLNRTLVDWDGAIKRCQQAFIPTHLVDTPNPSLGQQVVEQSAHHLCISLHRVLVDEKVLEVQKSHLQELMDILKWPVWKDCQPACALDQICFTAIWPFGTQEDHDRPSCMNATAIRKRYGYWNKT